VPQPSAFAYATAR